MHSETQDERSTTHSSPDVERAVAALTGPSGPGVRFADELAERRVECDAIAEMLMRGMSSEVDRAEAEQVAHAVAAGCLGERHLWRDMELADRPTLRALMETYFGPFAARNTKDMRWKKFIYRRLCRWEGFHTCRAPSCGECSEYAECFVGDEA